MYLEAVKTPIFKKGENLLAFLKKSLPLKLSEKSIVVITSKIVALSQRRVVKPSQTDWDKLIKKESDWAIPTKYCYLTLKEGVIAPNAGIDKSNAAGQWILWPKDSWRVTATLWRQLRRHYRLKNLGVLITDSRTLPLRKGIVGVALAYAGFKGLRSYVGKQDIFGYVLKFSRTDVADSLATAAVLLMGEAAEQTPLAVITEAPVIFSRKVSEKELRINPADDIYRPLFASLTNNEFMVKIPSERITLGGNGTKPCFVSPFIEKIAREIGVEINLEPTYGYVGQIVLSNDRKRYFRSTNFDLNPLGASEIARDKAYASYFMGLMGYPQVEGDTFFTEHWCAVIGSQRNPEMAYRYARRLGFPVIVKPNSKNQGSGVCKVHNKKEFMQAVRALSGRENVFLVQRVALGRDYRIVVLDREIISAYQRLPLSVVGNGRSTIQQLLRFKQQQFRQVGRDTVLPLEDFRITNQLRRSNLSLLSVLPKGKRVELLSNANLSSGGDALDVTRTMHPTWRRLAIRLARDMNLRYCGIDVVTEGTLGEPPTSYFILEINAAPGLDNYASSGARQRRIVERMYRKVLEAMLR